jgi:hypothetical protein
VESIHDETDELKKNQAWDMESDMEDGSILSMTKNINLGKDQPTSLLEAIRPPSPSTIISSLNISLTSSQGSSK